MLLTQHPYSRRNHRTIQIKTRIEPALISIERREPIRIIAARDILAESMPISQEVFHSQESCIHVQKNRPLDRGIAVLVCVSSKRTDYHVNSFMSISLTLFGANSQLQPVADQGM